jgi:hypothetical protein
MEVFLVPFQAKFFAPLRPSQLVAYRDAWMYFQYVGMYNYTVRQRRLADVTAGISYFRFPSDEDKQRYTLGLQLYLRAYPEYRFNLSAIIPEEV